MHITTPIRTMAGAAQAALLVLLAPLVAHAQAISPADYFPLGQGFQWQYERVAGSGQSGLHLEVTDVNVTDTGTRYFLEVPSNGVNLGLRLEYTPDGSLRLRAVEADLNALLDGLPLDPTATADVQFMPPVLLGPAPLVPGSVVVETPVDTEFDADLDTNIGSVDLDIHSTGTISARWDPAQIPAVTPAGSFSDVVAFTLDVSLSFSEDVFDTTGSVKERVTGVLARGVGFVQLQIGDTSYALDRAIVNGVPIGDFPQYEDIVGLAFTVAPPVILIHERALGDASSGSVALHDVRLSQAIFGKTELNAVLDHPSATGVPIYAKGPSKAKGDGTLHVKLDGKSPVGDKKVKFHAAQLLDPTSTTIELTAKVGKTKTTIPIVVQPLPSDRVRVSLDGFVDQSAQAGSTRKLASNGRLLLGDTEYAIVAKETLKVKGNGSRHHTYNIKPAEKTDVTVVHVEAKSTSAADFTITKLKPTLYKREVKKKNVTSVTADVVQP
jgi:hypothetical protein